MQRIPIFNNSTGKWEWIRVENDEEITEEEF